MCKLTEERSSNSEKNTSKLDEPEIKQLAITTDKENGTAHSVIEEVIKHFPKRIKARARLIGGYLSSPDRNKQISHNSKGELIVGEQEHEGTSLGDLLYDASCGKRSYVPKGAQEFYEALYGNNAPAGLILNTERRKWMKGVPKIASKAGDSSALTSEWKKY